MRKIWHYLISNVKNIVIIFLLSLFFVLFYLSYLQSLSPISSLINVTSKTFLVSISSLILLVLIYYWKDANRLWQRYKNNFRINNPPFSWIDYVTLFVFFSLFLLALLNNKLLMSSEFKVFILINLLFVFLWIISSYFLTAKDTTRSGENKELFALLDEPIANIQQDMLGRGKFINDLYDEICNLPFEDSFIMGLYGKWGEGKTSTVNMLINKFMVNDKYLIVNFEPWYFKDIDLTLNAYYKKLEKMINKTFFFPNLKRMFSQYQKMTFSGLNIFGVNIGFSSNEETIEEIKAEIESFIEKTKKKILVVIDDIDRMQGEDILSILKLVKLNSKFKNTIFVLCFDCNAVVENINKIIGDMGSDYLAKIIQKPIVLPKIEQHYINKFIYYSDHKIPKQDISVLKSLPIGEVSISGIILDMGDNSFMLKSINNETTIKVEIMNESNAKFKELDLHENEEVYVEGELNNGVVYVGKRGQLIRFRLSWVDAILYELLLKKRIKYEDIEKFDKDFTYFYNSFLYRKFLTLRSAKRYLNSLYSSLPAIVEEVNIKDFCLLEFIKVFYPNIYNDIFENWWFYVDQRAANDITPNPLDLYSLSDKTKKNSAIKAHVNKIFEKHIHDDIDRDIIKEILFSMFPNVKEALR